MVEAEATPQAVKLIQAGAAAPTEEIVAGGLEAAKPALRELCRAQSELAEVAAKPVQEFPVFLDYQDDVYAAVTEAVREETAEALKIAGKQEREEALDRVKAKAHEVLDAQFEGREKEISAAFRSVTKAEVRQRVLREQVRIDGRGPRDIRPLSAEVGLLPRVHGSALFERGETQIMGVTTLNMLRMEQALDTLAPEKSKRYMHNYNFPPYSTGETGRVGSPKRREIGHGALAERALVPVLPSREEFPYAIRQVSEALGSNGSTSMGSVCASTLALLSAGVPLKAPVAGIAMGLISDEVDGKTEYIALTDILGAEDAFGDMDFKVAGTSEFVTALQLDTKLDGIPSDVLAGALQQAHEARATILGVMAAAIEGPASMSDYAPRVTSVKIPVDKIGMVIGPKGQTINAIQDETGADISIEDDGTIYVGATNGPAADAAVERINAIANPTLPKVGDKYLGTVVKTAAFGAFISLLPGRDGLLHISKVGDGKRVEKVEDFLNVGDKVEVSIAAPAAAASEAGDKPREERAPREGGDAPRRRRSRPSGDRGGDRG
jgi:polyribonucleotide nucleotidyltransferase